MTDTATNGLFAFLTSQDSVFIYLFVLLGFFIVLMKPTIEKYIEARRLCAQETLAHTASMKEKENQINIQMISAITSMVEVNTALKTVIEQGNMHCDSCKADQMLVLNRVLDETTEIKVAMQHVEKRGRT